MIVAVLQFVQIDIVVIEGTAVCAYMIVDIIGYS